MPPVCAHNPPAPFKGGLGSGHALLCKEGSEDTRLGGAGSSASFPHGKLPHPSHDHGQVGHDGQGYRLAHGVAVQPHDLPGAAGRPDHTEDPLVPPMFGGHHLIGESAEYFIGQDNSRDDRAAVGTQGIGHSQNPRDHIAWMSAARRKVSVVAVQIAHHDPIGESSQIRRTGL